MTDGCSCMWTTTKWGGDPLPGAHKRLRVQYMYDGQERNVVVDEKTDLQLP
jgi:Domain of unknown function (DUF3395)